MSQALSGARRQLVQVNSMLRQNNILPAVKSARAGVLIMLQHGLLKGEREEFAQLISDAAAHIGNNATVRKIFPLSLAYEQGHEREFLEVLDSLLEVLSEEALESAQVSFDAAQAAKRDALAKGQAELDQGRHQEARRTFSDLAAEHADDADLRVDIGERFLKAGLLDDATGHLESAADMGGCSAYGYNHLAISMRKLGRFDAAREYFNKALALDDQDSNIYFNLGRLYIDSQDWEKAMAAGQKALELDPEFVEARKLAAYAEKKLNPPS